MSFYSAQALTSPAPMHAKQKKFRTFVADITADHIKETPDQGDVICSFVKKSINSSLPGQDGRHFSDDIFRCIFFRE